MQGLAMTLRTVLFTFFLIFMMPALAAGEEILCRQPHCFFTAGQPQPWPAPPEAETAAFRFGPFNIAAPTEWRHAVIAPDGGIIFLYGNGKKLGIWLETPEHYALSSEALSMSGYAFTDVPKIIYTQTPDQAPARNPAKMAVWNAAMTDKRIRFEGAQTGTIYQQPGLTAYYADIHFSEFTSDIIIASPKAYESQLRFLAKDIDSKTLTGIIGSVTLTEE
jgi:hypothetical protein